MILWQGFILALGALSIYFFGPKLFSTLSITYDREIFQTCVFTTLVLNQLLHAYNFRFSNTKIFKNATNFLI